MYRGNDAGDDNDNGDDGDNGDDRAHRFAMFLYSLDVDNLVGH